MNDYIDFYLNLKRINLVLMIKNPFLIIIFISVGKEKKTKLIIKTLRQPGTPPPRPWRP